MRNSFQFSVFSFQPELNQTARDRDTEIRKHKDSANTPRVSLVSLALVANWCSFLVRFDLEAMTEN